MALGPLTTQLLLDVEVPPEIIDGIKEGRFEWTIGLAPAIGVSASEEAARDMARASAQRKDFGIGIFRSAAAQAAVDPYGINPGGRVYEAAVPNALGQRIARTRRYEETLAVRGEAMSVLFAHGNVDDWTSVEHESPWDVVAYEFRRAAEIVAGAHTTASPAPTLALLYMCRHHLELSLKAIIAAGRRLTGAAGNVPAKHPLLPLWNIARPLLRSAWCDGWSDEDAVATRAVIAAFDEVDASSMATRYPVDRENVPFPRPASLANFSVSEFMGEFGRAADFLSAAILWIEVGLLVRETIEDPDR